MTVSFQFTAEVALSGAATVVSLAVAAMLWRRRGTSGTTSLIAFAVAVAVWTGGNAAQVAVTSRSLKLLAVDVQYVGIVVVPVAWFAFAATYTRRADWLTRRTLALLAIHPVVTLALVWSNDLHGLVRTSTTVVESGGVLRLQRSFGPWFWISVLYANVLQGVGTVLLLRRLVRTTRVYRGQLATILVGATVPWFAATAFNLGWWNVEPESFFVVTVVAFTVALRRYGLADLSPVARSAVVRNLPDPMIVTDGRERVADANPAAVTLVGAASEDDLIGTDVRSAFAETPKIVDVLLDDETVTDGGGSVTHAATGDGDVDSNPATISITTDGIERFYTPQSVKTGERGAVAGRNTGDGQAASSGRNTGDGRGTPGGRVILLRDVTAAATRRTELERQNRRLEHVTDVLSHDLRNPLEVASGFLPVALEGEEEAAERVRDAHDRMGEIVEEALRATRRDVVTPEMDVVSLSTAASSAWRTVETNNSTLSVPLDCTVEADPGQLQTLLENLFRNAVEHSTDAVTVTVAPLATDESGRSVVDDSQTDEFAGFAVADDGPGIPQVERDDVFVRGHSGDDGTGLGLAIVAEIVAAHDWTVEVRESVDGGAQFDVTAATVTRPVPDTETETTDGDENTIETAAETNRETADAEAKDDTAPTDPFGG